MARLDTRFTVPPYDYAAAERLAAALGVSHVLAQVLTRRGLGEEAAARAFLAADESHPLDAFGGLREAAARVLEHVRRQSRITVHGDYDVDGVTSTAILVRALRTVGADVDWYLPSRIDDGYGLAASTVERLAARGTDLLITVDCAITAVDEVAAARAAGLDVVVTDHHSPRADGRLPDAPIVHPRLGGAPSAAGGGAYPGGAPSAARGARIRARICARRGSPTSSRRRCSRARGRTRRSRRRTSTSSRSPRWPTSCRSSARTGGSCAKACARWRARASPACGR